MQRWQEFQKTWIGTFSTKVNCHQWLSWSRQIGPREELEKWLQATLEQRAWFGNQWKSGKMCNAFPEPIRHCKISCIPKRDKHLLKPNELRPISILSVFWRAWSSTWLRAECNHQWISQLFPKHAAGGLPGSLGPEALASVVAHQLSLFGHGVSLDLSHAFDAVNLDLMERGYGQVIAGKMPFNGSFYW